MDDEQINRAIKEIESYDRAKDELLVRMADAVGVCLIALKQIQPHLDQQDRAIKQLSDAINNFRKVLDK